MHAAASSKRTRTDQAQGMQAPPLPSPIATSTSVLEQQRALTQRRLSDAIEDARRATAADLHQRVERLRDEGEQQRDLLQRLMASGDMGALAIAAQRAAEVKAERERCEEQLATLQQGQRRAQTLAAVVEQQGVVADLLRLLVLQERVLGHDMSEEERLGVWSEQSEAGVAWERLSAELENATASDPLAGGWAEGERVPAAAAPEEEQAAGEGEEEAPIVRGPGSSGGGGGSAGSAATAVAAGSIAPHGRPLQPAGPNVQALPVQQLAFSSLPAQAGFPLQVWTGPLAGTNPVSLLRWPTRAASNACALLVRDPRTGQEVERPYHEGMEQQLPERFKVKFTARMPKSVSPVSSVPLGRSFLFLHRSNRKGVMTLLGVVEAAELVERSAEPSKIPHVYHLHVRRLQDPTQGDAGGAHPGLQGGQGAALRDTLVHHFGVSVAQALATPVLLYATKAMYVLHLPGGTPRIPSG